MSSELVSTLRGFGVHAEISDVQHGAAVDRYMLTLAPGTKVSSVTKLADDIALAMEVEHVRIVTDKGRVGVEVPAQERSSVSLEHLAKNLQADHPLRVPVGMAVDGSGVMARIDKLPHLLVAGTTGSGKSVWLTSILTHLATHAKPTDVQMMMVDPKRVELAMFADIPHLTRPVAKDVSSAVELLDAAVEEMEARYDRLERAGKRDIAELEDAPPYLVVAVEEMADLMMTAGKRAEAAIVRLLQVGRAAGVHLLLATQRPSADVITPLIKANTPSRLAFAVQSHTDSGVALGQSGAEALLGRGDGLWFPSGASRPERIQAPYVSTEGIEEALRYVRRTDEDIRARMLARARGAATPVEPVEEATPVEPAPTPVEPEPTPVAPHPGTFTWREMEQAMEEAYLKGRRHRDITETPQLRRGVSLADAFLAGLVLMAGVLVGIITVPVLPLVLGGWAAWTVTRYRTKITQKVGGIKQ